MSEQTELKMGQPVGGVGPQILRVSQERRNTTICLEVPVTLSALNN